MPPKPKPGSLKKDKVVKDVIKKDVLPGSSAWNKQFANKAVADSALIYLNNAVQKDATGKKKVVDLKSWENYLRQYKKLIKGGTVKSKKK